MSKIDEMLQTIEATGSQIPGVRLLVKYLYGERLSRGQAMAAKCADCMGYFSDGRVDCEIPECPMYPYMPYRAKKEKTKKGKVLSEEHKAKMKAGRLLKYAK
uniref:Uncharacterized protein n=1 Tax=viral metagenome TaxID=1070528 RepID=A0A6H1ZYS8_9ZZZZ